jgi:hypothetical protein
MRRGRAGGPVRPKPRVRMDPTRLALKEGQSGGASVDSAGTRSGSDRRAWEKWECSPEEARGSLEERRDGGGLRGAKLRVSPFSRYWWRAETQERCIRHCFGGADEAREEGGRSNGAHEEWKPGRVRVGANPFHMERWSLVSIGTGAEVNGKEGWSRGWPGKGERAVGTGLRNGPGGVPEEASRHPWLGKALRDPGSAMGSLVDGWICPALTRGSDKGGSR